MHYKSFTLPMRNWHYIAEITASLNPGKFYITYEELTLLFPALFLPSCSSVLHYLWGIDTLSIIQHNYHPHYGIVLHYLWGIDTYVLFKVVVFIITFYITYEELTRFLPYICFSFSWSSVIWFYITYEELTRWKILLLIIVI